MCLIVGQGAGSAARQSPFKVVSPNLPLVTIGVCVRNCANLVGSAINSIANQDYPSALMEVIFVDDGSTDKTLDVIESHVGRMKPTYKVIHQEWKGLGPTRNVVVSSSRGKYIIWVDGDMELARDFVRTQVSFMECNADVGIAKGSYGVYRANLVSTLENLEFVTTNSEKMRKADPNPLGTGGSIYRVSAIKEIGGFNNDIKGSGEDADAEYRIEKAGWLLDTTSAIFFEKRRNTWRSLLDEYFWHGRGSSRILKGKTSTRPFKMLPPVALIVECLRVGVAYKLTRRKTALLLPLHYTFKRTAWFLGFLLGWRTHDLQKSEVHSLLRHST